MADIGEISKLKKSELRKLLISKIADESKEEIEELEGLEDLDDVESEEEEPKPPPKKTPKPKPKKMTRGELKRRKEESEEEEEESEEEPPQQPQTLLTAQREIEHLTNSFKALMEDKIAEVKKYKKMKLLTDKFVNETIAYHNDYRARVEEEIEYLTESLNGEEFPKAFVSKTNRVFDGVLKKMEKALG